MGKNDFDVNLVNCRNISSVDGGSILIKKNALNVFYGKNGTGKTTLVKALEYIHERTDENKAELSSFKYLESGDPADEPNATCKTRIKNMLVFNQEWVEQHCFGRSTMHQNAFELYVRDAKIKKLEKQREKKVSQLSKVLLSSDVEELKSSLSTLQKGLGKLKTNGEFVASAPAVKGFKGGVPIEEVPRCLLPVISKMTASEKAKWVNWHVNSPHIHDISLCPYCGTQDRERLEQCEEYDNSRDSSSIKQWAVMADAFDVVGHRLSRSNRALMGSVLRSKKAPNASQLAGLAALSSDVARAIAAIDGLERALSDERCVNAKVLTDTLSDHAKVLKGCSVFLKTSGGKNTIESKAISQMVNAINGIVSAQEELDALSKELMARIASNVSGHEDEINEFLKQCGYRYTVRIDSNPQTSEASMLLLANYAMHAVDNAKESLSFGEQNALALALFMFEVLHEQHPLVVLDDPISSFDYDKRYGILYALFAEDSLFSRNLRGETVLVMTHDFLVVSDLIKMPGKGLSRAKGQFLSSDAAGILHAVPLGQNAIAPYTQLLRDRISASRTAPEIIRLIYIRNLCEMLRTTRSDRRTRFGWTFRLLSDVIHGRSKTEILAEHGLKELDCRVVRMCENCVKKLTGDEFDYWKAVDRYSDCVAELVSIYETGVLSAMEKLHVVRLLIERDATLAEGSKIMKRFADESCHIGGSYLYQMDWETFDQVPFYVIEWCDEVVAHAKVCLETTLTLQ